MEGDKGWQPEYMRDHEPIGWQPEYMFDDVESPVGQNAVPEYPESGSSDYCEVIDEDKK